MTTYIPSYFSPIVFFGTVPVEKESTVSSTGSGLGIVVWYWIGCGLVNVAGEPTLYKYISVRLFGWEVDAVGNSRTRPVTVMTSPLSTVVMSVLFAASEVSFVSTLSPAHTAPVAVSCMKIL